ncbi:MAG TPA: ABC transporter transmembrane domain-containing protein [Pseudolabrys sp.]|nr:ABC transporter transmembrane domain-containing protein [Pseudolabrys sp.]
MSRHPGLHAMVWLAIAAQLIYKLGAAFCYQQIFDEGITRANSTALYEAVIILAALLLLFAAALLLQERVMSTLGMRVTSRLRMRLFRKLLALSPGYHAKTSPSELIDRMGSDIGAFELALVRALPVLLFNGSLVFASVVLLFAIEWRLAVVVLASVPLTLFASKPFGSRATEENRGAGESRARLLALTQEAVSGHLVIRLFGMGNESAKQFDEVLTAVNLLGGRAHFYTGLIARSAQVASGITQLIIIGFGGWLAFSGYMTGGFLIAFVGLLMGIGDAVNYITGVVPILSYGAESLSSIDRLLGEPDDIADRPDAAALVAPRGEIRFDNVCFSYADTPALEAVSFTVKPGESVAFVGPSGSGKSTVLALLTRLYEPQSGVILLDDAPLGQATEASLRDIFTAVPQASILFRGSIRYNVSIARPSATDAEIAAAARAAALDDVIRALPERLATQVGEGGCSLSGGQRQRIAIARAFLRNAPILILDEATSALDPVSEATVNQSIANLAGRVTVFAATHRLTSVTGFDRILVFDHGRLVQSGSHQILLAQGGLYARLWEKVSGLEIAEDASDAVIAPSRLENVPFLAGCPAETLAALATLFIPERIKEGRDVFRQGDAGEKFYIIARGTVEVLVAHTNEDTRRAAFLRDGDFFGEIALVTDRPRNATIRTVTDCWFLTLHRISFLGILEREPKLRDQIMETVARRSN